MKRIIEIINKIANGEEPPKTIWYNNNPFTYKDGQYIYDSGDYYNKTLIPDYIRLYAEDLNEEVEVDE